MSIASNQDVIDLIRLAKQEDLGSGDISSHLLPNPNEPSTFALLMKGPGIFCGREIADAVLHAYDEGITLDWHEPATDGARFNEKTELTRLTGPLSSILSAERVLLNFLQRLSGIATLTRRFVDAIEGTQSAIYDTRKTTPGWRTLEKYAVRCGGGRNHRMGLYDAVLIKDNHLAGIPLDRLSYAVFEMLNRIGAETKPTFIEVEVDSLEACEQLLSVVGIDVILLDNFALNDLRAAVELRDQNGLRGKVELEASGGITLDTARSVAETGVDRISIGAITHSATALDLSLERI